MFPYVLTIIDVQYKFDPCETAVLQNIYGMVERAVQDGAFIIVAHYGDVIVREKGHPESTLSSILSRIADYGHTAFVAREHRNKSPVIVPIINGLNLASQTVKVCGLYTDLCIHDTIRGLLRSLPGEYNVEVFLDACIYYRKTGLYRSLARFGKMNRLTTIGVPVGHENRQIKNLLYMTLTIVMVGFVYLIGSVC